MTVVMPQIVPPPLLTQTSPGAKLLNSDKPVHPISIRDITKEKDVVSLIANSTDNDKTAFVKCIPHGSDTNAVGELAGQLVSPSKDRQHSLPAGPEGANGTQDQTSPHYQQQQRRNLQSKGISILKPMFDRDNEPLDDAELEAVTDKKWNRSPKKPNKVGGEVHNAGGNMSLDGLLPQKNPQYTIAQILDDVQKRKMKAEQDNNGCKTSPGGQPPSLATSMGLGQTPSTTQRVATTSSSMARSALTTKPSNAVSATGAAKGHSISAALADFPRNSSLHLTNFIAKSMHTPPLINSAPHPMTAPGFAHNLTESVQKVMSAIPCDSLSPPLHPPRPNRPHSRANISPSAKEKHADPPSGGESAAHVRVPSSATVPSPQLTNAPISSKTGSQKGATEASSSSSPPKDTTTVKQERLDSHRVDDKSNLVLPAKCQNVEVKMEEPKLDNLAAGPVGGSVSTSQGSSTTASMQHVKHAQTNQGLVSPTTATTNPIKTDTPQAAVNPTGTSKADHPNMTPVKSEPTPAPEAPSETPTPAVQETLSKSSTRRRKSSEREEARPAAGRITRRRSRESTESQQGKECREESPRVTPTRGRKKSASESSDATMNSEASSECGMTLRGSRSTDRSSERSESPPASTRTMRSTRSGRKKTPTDGEESTTVPEADRSESPKPTKQTRGSKRRLELDDSGSNPEKKSKTDDSAASSEHAAKEGGTLGKMESSEDDLTLSEIRSKTGSTGGGGGGGAKNTRSGTKAGATTKEDQQTDEKISPKGRKSGGRQEEGKEVDEQNGSKRASKGKTAGAEEATPIKKATVVGTATRRATEKRPKSPTLQGELHQHLQGTFIIHESFVLFIFYQIIIIVTPEYYPKT